MAATETGKTSSSCKREKMHKMHSRRLYRFALGLWSAVGLVALLAPWPYAMGAVLFATFLHFSALDEGPDRS
jgi:hypothetical protein